MLRHCSYKRIIHNIDISKQEAKVATKEEKQAVQEPAKKKILFLVGESAPFIRTGGLGICMNNIWIKINQSQRLKAGF